MRPGDRELDSKDYQILFLPILLGMLLATALLTTVPVFKTWVAGYVCTPVYHITEVIHKCD
jgi:hypothetical protein